MGRRENRVRVGVVEAALACLVALSCPQLALAAELPSDANGIKLGEARLHPYVQSDMRWIQNPYLVKPKDAVGDLVLAIRPGFDLVLPSDTVDLKLNGDVEYQHYFGVMSKATSNLDNFLGQGTFQLALNKKGGVSVELAEHFLRVSDPDSPTTRRLMRVANDAGLSLQIRPGGGALIFRPAYRFYYERFDRDNPIEDVPSLDNMRHIPSLKATWKFLPKTGVFVEVEAHITRYPNGSNVPSNIMLSYLGAQGSLTQRIALLLKAGYGNTLIRAADLGPDDSNFSSFIGQAEVNYLATESTRLRAGVLRTVQPTSYFKYFDMVRGYIGVDQAFGGRVLVALGVSYDYLTYGLGLHDAGQVDHRNDSNVIGNLTLTYEFTPWLNASISDHLDWRASDYTAPAGTRENYFFNDIFLRIAARY